MLSDFSSHLQSYYFVWGFRFFLFLFFSKLFSTDLSNKSTVLCCIHPALLPAFNHISVSQSQDQLPFVKLG